MHVRQMWSVGGVNRRPKFQARVALEFGSVRKPIDGLIRGFIGYLRDRGVYTRVRESIGGCCIGECCIGGC